MIDSQRKKYGLECAERMDKILHKAITEMMDIALDYNGKLEVEDVLAITKITVEHFSSAFEASFAKTKTLAEKLRKSSNNQT